jgi:anti-anti-sigma factor
MPRISFRSGLVRGVPVVSAPDRLDAGNAHLLHAAITRWAVHGYATLVVDMTATRLCDTAAFKVLLRAHRRAQAEGGEVRVVVPSRLRLLAAAGHDGLMRRFGSVAGAVAELPAVAIEPIADLTA